MITTPTTTHWDAWGLGAPEPTTPDGPDDEPEREVNVSRWQVALAIGIAAMFVLPGLAAVVFFASRAGAAPSPAPVQRSSFVDQFGRQCTQVRAGDAVALDCDAKPIESRLGGALEGLAGQ